MSFKAVAKQIAAKSGEPMANANAMLAASSRNASPAAKKKNPNLNKVKGGPTKPTFKGRRGGLDRSDKESKREDRGETKGQDKGGY